MCVWGGRTYIDDMPLSMFPLSDAESRRQIFVFRFLVGFEKQHIQQSEAINPCENRCCRLPRCKLHGCHRFSNTMTVNCGYPNILPPIHNRTVDLKGILDYEITSGMGIQLGPEFQQTQLSEKPVRDHITP